MEEFDGWSEPDVLGNCSLVSWTWKRAAQPRIFNRIQINNGDQCKFWSKKIKEFPHIGPYVKELSLADPDDDCMGRPYLRGRAAKALLSGLPCVKSLEVDDFKRWGPVEQRLIKGLQSLHSLRVDDIPGMSRRKDLPDLLYALPNVDEFTPGEVGEAYDENELEAIRETGLVLQKRLPDDGKPRVLREIVLFDAQLSIDKLMWLSGPAFELSQLKTLALIWGDFFEIGTVPYFAALDDFIRLVGEHVEDLDLEMPVPLFYEDVMDPITLINNPLDLLSAHFSASGSLRHFTAIKKLVFELDPEECTFSLGLNNVIFMLKTLSAPNLETIEYNSGIIASPWRMDVLAEIADWKVLDEILVGKSLPSLRSIAFTVSFPAHGPLTGVRDAISDIIKKCLPNSFAKGLVQVNVTFTERIRFD
ncbi:hypothetical protein V5O48_006449 [Marasmius crinis-equi]|uniref:Uncharacterized protein n=1 Tax=Marasmius crinis-equi TaxID=585013 RepID=A0ABR3FJH0_9AGAR